MSEGPKQLRIYLSADDMAALLKAKRKMENLSGVSMSDSKFAVGLIRRALQANSEVARNV